MSYYEAIPGARVTISRPLFADFKLNRLWTGPGKIAHVFFVSAALIPFYLFSSAYRSGLTSPTARAESRYLQQTEDRLAGRDPYLIYRQRTLADRRSKS